MEKNPLNLYCLPFAGGSAYSYKAFSSALASSIHLIPLELPGHGRRINEALLNDITAMARDAAAALRARQDFSRPYALYGHSMGGILGYEVLRLLREQNHPLPAHFIISGCNAPHHPRDKIIKSTLTQNEFISLLKELGGCPPEILAHEELMDLFIPVLRADFKAVEDYNYQTGRAFSTKLTVLYGKQDKETDLAGLEAWNLYSTLPLTPRAFAGGHFFIFEEAEQVGKLLSNLLNSQFPSADAETKTKA